MAVPPPRRDQRPVPGTSDARERIERDPLGEVRVPASAYYGAQTQRAVENFPISGLTAFPELVTATVHIKKAAAEANRTLGRLPAEIADAIVRAADEVLSGQLRDQFVVDIFQAGAGTSHNMRSSPATKERHRRPRSPPESARSSSTTLRWIVCSHRCWLPKRMV